MNHFIISKIKVGINWFESLLNKIHWSWVNIDYFYSPFKGKGVVLFGTLYRDGGTKFGALLKDGYEILEKTGISKFNLKIENQMD